jgi:hypothetical protein
MSEYIITDKELGRFEIPSMFTEREIVRCKDCKHFGTRNGLGLCKRWSYFSICSQPDDFCSRAERRDA